MPNVPAAQAPQQAAHEATRPGAYFVPNVDILEAETELIVRADVPGARSDAIEVKFEDGLLEIRATPQDRQAEGTRWLRREYGVAGFYRAFRVSEAIDAGRISADVSDGVLTLRLPKAASRQPRRIPVQAK